MATTKYGVIADIHQDPTVIIPTVKFMESAGVDKFIVNGDIGSSGYPQQNIQFTAYILEQIARSGKEMIVQPGSNDTIQNRGKTAFVQPGSHESVGSFELAVRAISEKHSNIVSAIEHPKYEASDHHLVFLPGSDFNAGGEYTISANPKLPTGRYARTAQGLVAMESIEDLLNASAHPQVQGIGHFFNMYDLRKQVTHPDKTIFVCHVPRKFENPDTCVDMAHFYQMTEYSMNKESGNIEAEEKFVMPGVVPKDQIEEQIGGKVYGIDTSDEEIRNAVIRVLNQDPYEKIQVMKECKANRGNVALGELLDELGVTKALSNHFHESSQRAHTKYGKPVKEGKLVDELYWNSGHLDRGFTGIMTVTDGRVSYQNANVRK